MKKHVYKVGDRVRILRPRLIRRVGYPLHFIELREEARGYVRGIGKQLGFQHEHTAVGCPDLIDGLAKALVHDRRFGGNTRSIHYYTISDEKAVDLSNSLWADIALGNDLEDDWKTPRPDPTGLECEVQGKYIRKTGNRSPAYYGGYCEDYEPGYLADEQTHIILHTRYGDIETCDVEPV